MPKPPRKEPGKRPETPPRKPSGKPAGATKAAEATEAGRRTELAEEPVVVAEKRIPLSVKKQFAEKLQATVKSITFLKKRFPKIKKLKRKWFLRNGEMRRGYYLKGLNQVGTILSRIGKFNQLASLKQLNENQEKEFQTLLQPIKVKFIERMDRYKGRHNVNPAQVAMEIELGHLDAQIDSLNKI